MSQMFDRYRKGYVDSQPNNLNESLDIPPEYKDDLILDADNSYSFKIPHLFNELLYIEITYTQGTEIKLIKSFDMSKFIPENSETRYVYDDETQDAGLVEIVRNIQDLEDGLVTIDEFYEIDNCCILYYTVTPEELTSFNDYNREVFIQLKTYINTEEDTKRTIKIEFSPIFKLRLIPNLGEFKLYNDEK